MKEKINAYREKVVSFWKERKKSQKGWIIGSVAAVILAAVLLAVLQGGSKMTPLYSDLTLQEIGQIKSELDTRGIPYELDKGGTTILVPDTEAESLLVDLAASGLPNSGRIDYGFFSANTSWGMTDNEFDVIKLDAMQTELANLMKGISGIQDAQVMINMPEEQVFASEQGQEASASVVLNVQPGASIEQPQVETLYNLVSKSVPNLSKDNIVIMDQNFNYFDINDASLAGSSDAYTYQQNVKEDIERDIKQRLQRMLGTMIGQQKVMATVTADIDFTKENRVEELVEPVDPETMEGLPVSVERIEETYEGGVPEGGVPGAGDEDVANYPAGEEGGDGDYEMNRETINNEFNRIKRNIEESPYKVRNLGIQVAVDNTKGTNAEGEVEYLTAAEQQTVEEGIQSIVDSMITTSIDAGYEDQIEADENVSIVFQEFNGKPEAPEAQPGIPLWVYITGGVLALLIILLLILLFRRRNVEEEEEYVYFEEPLIEQRSKEVQEIQEKEDESTQKRKQLEKLANEKPEDFAKLLRSWIAED
ncbi:UNVERIFIED_CONTAM: flagellar basal-body MS-ring/collar protein FliF [Halobacillus marinus]|uniref:flagellar basal-body MS-ring/collar protein FliF n=1 Tax=Bacillaceae TaxID=186817 RepID=UPI0002A504DF|nr:MULTISPECIES: flagellar basal-body MS-ring/collar protein FliF [Bacillaceae]ELK44738.1 flagellar MS-ring protein [Halobacillus sp. BAB-2008]QHT46654.1 flagellar basal body M-ring protein FliF [Bacillus sp. SB49]